MMQSLRKCSIIRGAAYLRGLSLCTRHYTATSKTQLKSYNDIPTPKPCYPIVGNALDFLDATRIHKLFLKYSTQTNDKLIKLKLGPFEEFVLVNDPQLANHVLTHNNGDTYCDRTSFPIVDYAYARFVGLKDIPKNIGGVTFTNGRLWRRNRKLTGQALRSKKFVKRSAEVINTCMDQLALNWKAAEASNAPIEISTEMSKLAIDIMGHTAYSVDLGALTGKHHVYTQHVKVLLDTIQRFLYLPFPAICYKYYRTKEIRDFDAAIDSLRHIGDTLAKNRLAEGVGKKIDLLDFLLNREETGMRTDLDLNDVHAILMDILGAGHDTTANLFSFCLSKVTEYPEIVLKIREELNSKLVHKEKGSPIDIEEIEDLPYLTAVIKETLRMYPLGAAFTRVATADDIIDDYEIPEGSKFLISPFAMGNHPRFWSNTERFDPDRFIVRNSPSTAEPASAECPFGHKAADVADSKPLNFNLQAWVPFGVGARTCIGYNFGMMEAKLVLARIFRDFDMVRDAQTPHTDSRLAFTLRLAEPMHLHVKAL